MKRALLVIFALTICMSVFAQDNFDTVRIRSQRVSENIYMLKGAGGNIAVLTGPDGIFMVDDQFAPLSDKIRSAVKNIDAGMIRYVVNTHIHGDHSGGNEKFTKAGASVVAHDNVRSRMMVEQRSIKSTGTEPAREKDAWPIVTFADKMSFHANGQDIDLIHFDKGHTDGDIIIFFKTANVLHAGDLFVRYGFPYIDFDYGGGINGFINNLNKMLLLMDDNTRVIPGHGEIATKNDVRLFAAKITDIRDRIAAALKKGKKPGEIPALGITDKYPEWAKGFIEGKDFALLVAEDLAEPSTRKR